MKLEIATINGLLFSGEVTAVNLPGINGSFSVLENHAPLISKLTKGKIRYVFNANKVEIETNAGYVEVNNNQVIVCLDTANDK